MKAGFYESDITHPLGGHMSGPGTSQYSVDVMDRLYAKALVIESEGKYAAFVCVDSCTLPRDLHDFVTNRIKEYTDMDPSCICITSNHAHRGVAFTDEPELEAYADKNYRHVTYQRIADTVVLAYRRLVDVTLCFETVKVPGLAFCRNSVMPDGTYRTFISDKDKEIKPLSEVDDTFTFIAFRSNDKIIGTLSSFPLHQDTAGVSGHCSGDYSSAISQNLKEKYGRKFVSLFLIGCSGDVNHIDHDRTHPTGVPKYHRVIGKILADNLVNTLDNAKFEAVEGVSVVKYIFDVDRRKINTEDYYDEFIRSMENPMGNFLMARRLMYYLTTNKTEVDKLYMQCVKIGEICIYCLPGEVYSASAFEIKEKSPFEKTLVIENANSYCGYIPTPNGFDKNSKMYETVLAYTSCLNYNASETIVKEALKAGNMLK